MWSFRASKPLVTTPDRHLEARLEALSTDLATIRREWDAQQLDYGEVLAKLARWAGRQAARERKSITSSLDGAGESSVAAAAEPLTLDTPAGRATEKMRLRRLVSAQQEVKRHVTGHS